MFSHRELELENEEGTIFRVNDQRINISFAKPEEVKEAIEEQYLNEVLVIKRSVSCRDVKSRTTWEATQVVNLGNLKYFSDF